MVVLSAPVAGSGLCSGMGAASVAEGSEGGGVAAGLGGEVAPVAEHVGPFPQVEAGEFGELAEVPAGAQEFAGVSGDR